MTGKAGKKPQGAAFSHFCEMEEYMYLHIGGDKVVDDEEILLILPRETVMHSYENRRFMETAIGSGRVDDVSGGERDTYIITAVPEGIRVYASAVGAATIAKR